MTEGGEGKQILHMLRAPPLPPGGTSAKSRWSPDDPSAQRTFGRLLATALVMCAVGIPVPASFSMPAGRDWAAVETLKINGHAYMAPDRFEPMRDGRLEMIAAGLYGPFGEATYGLEWQDSTWVERWNSLHDAYAIHPTMTPRSHQMLVWKTTKPIVDLYYNQLVTADVVDGRVTQPDTIAKVATFALAYTGTSWAGRKWVHVRDFNRFAPGGSPKQRFFRSDAPGSWLEIGNNDLGSIGGATAMVATGPDSVLVVIPKFLRGLVWGWLSDTTFIEEGLLSQSPLEAYPKLRRRPSGGYWLVWGEGDSLLFARCFRGGAWTETETLRVALPGGVRHFFYDSVPSHDDEEFPAVMTEGYGISGDNPDHIFISFPTDSGFGVAERVEATRGSRIQTMGMDENGDVWLAWWVILDGLFWTHSYTKSTAAAPIVTEVNGVPTLSWRLSEPSPRTWWGVMRSVDGGPFERVARVRAGPGEALSWADSSAPTDARIEYAIRRESRDVRYQVTSGAATWEPRRAVLELSIRGPNPSSPRLELEVVGASAGPLEARVYDLQGRVVASQQFRALGSGRDVLTLSLGRAVPSGLYIVGVRSHDGRRGTHRKLLLVR